MERRFQDKVVLVTGSTQGIGAAVARRLATEGAAGILVTGRNAGRGAATVAALEALGCRAAFHPAELADPAECGGLIDAVDRAFGRIDVLVNAAALSFRGSLVDTDVPLWDTLMNVNVRAPFLLTQGAVRLMRRDRISGTIVNIGSVAAYGSETFLLPYSVSKGALMTLTKNVAYAVMRDRIRVNQINPGWMDTPGEDAIQRRYHSEGRDWLEQAESAVPFGRLIKPDELATFVAFLGSDDSGLMTGSIIDFDQSVTGAGPRPIPAEIETPR